tara:strand:- start:341 stop:568 length:228 start_codon:yes stop_codon:yes gene_type:complete
MDNMAKFWIIAAVIFIVTTVIVAKLTVKKFRKQTGERNWKLWYGRATYWEILCASTFGITMLLMFVLKWTSIIDF